MLRYLVVLRMILGHSRRSRRHTEAEDDEILRQLDGVFVKLVETRTQCDEQKRDVRLQPTLGGERVGNVDRHPRRFCALTAKRDLAPTLPGEW